MGISNPDWRWVNIFSVLDPVVNKGLRLSYALRVVCMRLPSRRISCGPFCVLDLFTQGVYNLM